MDPVIIVGGGPVGLTMSLLLSDLGVSNVLFERHQGTSIHPKAIGLNQRTIEIFRRLGLHKRIDAAAAPPASVARTGWYTSLAGRSDLHGRQIAVRDAWGGGRYAEEYAAASPAPYTMLPQIRLEPILRAAAEARPNATVRFSTAVAAIEQDETGVTVALADGERVRGSYLVGADGGKMVANALGIGFSGPTNLVDMVSAHFTADVTPLLPNRECLIYWFVNPDLGGSIGSGYLYHLGPWDDAGHSREWVFACGFRPDDPERFDEEAMKKRILRSLGVDRLEMDLHSVSHWY
ncbi:FAD-dependent monooxygenase, partial [Streptomyces violaceoruber]